MSFVTGQLANRAGFCYLFNHLQHVGDVFPGNMPVSYHSYACGRTKRRSDFAHLQLLKERHTVKAKLANVKVNHIRLDSLELYLDTRNLSQAFSEIARINMVFLQPIYHGF